jgi:LacI family transcriptional regulator
MKKSRVTLEDIARKINISRTTIYKVINNKGTVTEKTRQQVLLALEEFGYHPNLAARNLAMGKEYHIGFIGFTSSRSPYFLKNIQAGVEAASADLHDYGVHLHQRVFDLSEPEKQREALEELDADGIDGFILIPNDIRNSSDLPLLCEVVNSLTEKGKVIYTVNRDLPESRRHRYVGCDYRKSGALAAEILGKMASPGLVMVPVGGSEADLYDLRLRIEGFEEKISRFSHLKVLPYFHHSSEDPLELETWLEDTIESYPDISAIFDLSYELDVISKVVLTHPSIKAIGFDLCESIKNHMLEHTIDAIVFQDMFAQGFLAVKGLFENLSGQNRENENIITKLEVVFEENLDFYL